MAVGDHQLAPFTGPVVHAPRTAASVKHNDDTLLDAHNAHDADVGAHLSVGVINVEAYREANTTDTATLTATTRIRSFFYAYALSSIRILGLTFNQGVASLAMYTDADYSAAVHIASNYNMGVYLHECGGKQALVDCTFTHLYTTAVQTYNNAGHVLIDRCRFTSPAQAQKINLQHIQFATSSSDVLIRGCDFTNARPASADFGVGCVYASGTTGSLTFCDNTTDYGGRNSVGGDQLGTFSAYGNCVRLTVRNNIMRNNLAQVVRLSCVEKAEVSENRMEMADIALIGDNMISAEGTRAFAPGVVGVTDLKIRHNTFVDDYDDTRIGVFCAAYDYSCPSTDIWVTDNSFSGVIRQAFRLGGPFSGVRFCDNRSECELGFVLVEEDAGGAAILEAGGVVEADGVYEDLLIQDNVLVTTTASGGNPIAILWTKSPVLASQIGRVEISGNTVRSTAGGSGAAIVTRGSSGSDIGTFVMRGNFVENYATGFDLQHGNTLTLEDNQLRTVTTPTALAGFTHTVARGNRWSVGPSNGRAVLVGGTVTVSTAEVRASDNITLSRVLTGGTVGHLTVGTITAGTSFVINSSSASDTSTIYWEIRH